MESIMKSFVLTALAALALAGCMTEKERKAIAAEKARQEQLARAERERHERQTLAQKKQNAKQLVAEQKWQEVIDLCGNAHDTELAAYMKIARQHLAQEALRRERAGRVAERAASSLKDIREAYSHKKPAAYASRRNVNEDNFDCFRYWEIRSFGVKESIKRKLPFSKTPKLPTLKAKTQIIVKL